MLSYSAIKCTHRRLHQLSPTMMMVIMIWNCIQLWRADILSICGTLLEDTISTILPHLKNLRCHPCLPSWRHPWTLSYRHLKNLKVIRVWESFGQVVTFLLTTSFLFLKNIQQGSFTTWYQYFSTEMSQENKFCLWVFWSLHTHV